MNREALIQQFNQQQRIEIDFPGFRREMDGTVIRHVSLTEEDGFISYSRLEDEMADEAIRTQLDYFQQLGQRFEWKVYDYDQPADLKERLQSFGFSVGEPEALMVMELAKEHPLLAASLPDYVHRIDSEAGIDDIIALEEAVWGEPHGSLGERLKRDLKNDPDHLYLYAVYEGKKAVSAAWMYLHKGTSFASLWGGSTLPDYRQKGLYTSLIAARAQDAWNRGYRFLTVDASPMSRPILEKKGFTCLGYSYPCVSPPIEL
ncbi:GNAT family N-acetyltransferase [Anoxybacteroides tepidamans]|uniref:GNAT family N-acetyltransferase n=1 Tax=Anoxybacteroides tepidamans TaxID=265948 RepID=UPI000486438A|nr:GNAT family N-acetyltransferase [Anoxybacillus tepidamans]